MRPRVVAVVGGKKSGKTTVIELLTRELVGRGRKVAAVKHVPEPDFTIDTKGKDTWRFVQAGASTVIAVSANEVATIERTDIGALAVDKILLRCPDSDIVFLEGFRDVVSRDRGIAKIVIVSSEQEVEMEMKTFDPIIALVGFGRPKLGTKSVPYFDLDEGVSELADLLEEDVRNKVV